MVQAPYVVLWCIFNNSFLVTVEQQFWFGDNSGTQELWQCPDTCLLITIEEVLDHLVGGDQDIALIKNKMLHQPKKNSSRWGQTRCLFKSRFFFQIYIHILCLYIHTHISLFLYSNGDKSHTTLCESQVNSAPEPTHQRVCRGGEPFRCSFRQPLQQKTFPFIFRKLELSASSLLAPPLIQLAWEKTKHLQMPGNISPDWGLEEIPLPWHQNL